MKRNKLMAVLSVFLLALVGCSDDIDKIKYNPEDAIVSDFMPIKGNYVLSKDNDEEIVDVFQWGKMEFGYPAAVTYTVQVDIAGNNFANAQDVTATPKLSADILGKALNTSMVELQKIYKFTHGVAQEVEFRVKGSISDTAEPLYTTAQDAQVSSYFTYSKVWVIGDYCGWNHKTTQFLYGFNDEKKDYFEGWIGFRGKAANGFKITDSPGWDKGNWGLKEGDSYDIEASEVSLFNDGGSQNIDIYHKNFYKLGFDKTTETLFNIASMNTFGISGTAISGNDLIMGFDGDTQEFYLTATWNDGEIYFRADEQDGDLSYGLGESEGKLAKGTVGIPVKAGTYEVRVSINNDANLYYTISQGEALDPNQISAAEIKPLDDLVLFASATTQVSWSAVDFIDQKPAEVTYNLEMSLSEDFTERKLIVKGSDLTYTVSGSDLLNHIKELNSEAVWGQSQTVYWRIQATVMGIDNVFTSKVVSHELTINEDPEFPEQLYMIGEAFGNWDWSSEEVVKMTPVNGKTGLFWTIRYLEAGQPFKWNSKLDWGGDFANLSSSYGFKVDGGNALVEKSGLYMIFIDQVNDLISIETPQVFGIGDAFGSWDEGQNAFIIDDSKASIDITGNGPLRIYTTNSYANDIEWWRMEFVLRDGKIEYRGNKGDLDPVLVKQGQHLILDFLTDTGYIE